MLRWVESLSWRSRYLLTGDRRSWCAYAWDHRDRPHWRLHVAIWDPVFLTLRNERNHCARASAYWRRYGDKP